MLDSLINSSCLPFPIPLVFCNKLSLEPLNDCFLLASWLPQKWSGVGMGWEAAIPNKGCCVLQEACLQGNLIAICLEQLSDPHPLLRQWVAICLGRIWQNFDSARWCGVRDSAHEKLYSLLSDPIPEVKLQLCCEPHGTGRAAAPAQQGIGVVSASEKELAAVSSRCCKSNMPKNQNLSP